MSDLPQWYLDEALPRLKRIDELSPIAYPPRQPFGDWDAAKRMYEARREWDRLMREQCDAELDAGL